MQTRYLTDQEYDLVIAGVENFELRTDAAGRNAAGILLGLHGLRVDEVCRLNVRDFNPRQAALDVDTLKRGPRRDVELDPTAVAWLEALARGAKPGSPILRTRTGRRLHKSQLQRAWRRLSWEWLGRQVRFHDLRHTAAQRIYEATHDLLQVQGFLGHKSLSSTQAYAKTKVSVRQYMPKLRGGKPRLMQVS